jgi:hypothetical protein
VKVAEIAPMTARAQAMSLKRVASKFIHERFRRADSNLARERAIVSEIGLWELGMDDWDNFYMLAGGTAGTLIGIIFVVITLGIDHARKGDELRIRIFVTPILVFFASLLVVAMVMVPPMPNLARAVSLGAIGFAGIAYVLHLAYLSRYKAKADEQEHVWDVLLPLASYALTALAAPAWAIDAWFANALNAVGVLILLIVALRKSWIVTLVIADRD